MKNFIIALKNDTLWHFFLTLLDRFKNHIFYERKRIKKLEKVEQRIAETPNKSIRRLTQETNLSFGTVQLILKKGLHLFPYRVSVVHEIKPIDNKSPHHNITSLKRRSHR
jgi:hypothetical protein